MGFLQNNLARFIEAGDLEADAAGLYEVPDWLLPGAVNKRFIGGADPLQEVRVAPVLKLGFKPTTSRKSNPNLGEYAAASQT